jgi:D-3-phosphoglycerate dehydrogenase
LVSQRLVDYVRTGNSMLSVNLPHGHLEYAPGSHRLMHIRHNLPGILRVINDILADRGDQGRSAGAGHAGDAGVRDL